MMERRNHRRDSRYRMRNFTLLIGIAAVLVLISGVAQAAPRLIIPESSFDFGFVPQNSKISHTFQLMSTGDVELKILKVVPG